MKSTTTVKKPTKTIKPKILPNFKEDNEESKSQPFLINTRPVTNDNKAADNDKVAVTFKYSGIAIKNGD